jgi:hypothetical protein
LLCKKACAGILDKLVPRAESALGVERFDGVEDPIGEVLSSMNTYALLGGTKVVVLKDARLFIRPRPSRGFARRWCRPPGAGT